MGRFDLIIPPPKAAHHHRILPIFSRENGSNGRLWKCADAIPFDDCHANAGY
jgi:hypothetical protein